jgi:hypothetical protein
MDEAVGKLAEVIRRKHSSWALERECHRKLELSDSRVASADFGLNQSMLVTGSFG